MQKYQKLQHSRVKNISIHTDPFSHTCVLWHSLSLWISLRESWRDWKRNNHPCFSQNNFKFYLFQILQFHVRSCSKEGVFFIYIKKLKCLVLVNRENISRLSNCFPALTNEQNFITIYNFRCQKIIIFAATNMFEFLWLIKAYRSANKEVFLTKNSIGLSG